MRVGWHVKGRAVEQHQTNDPFGEAHGPGHADHRAPVMHDQGHAPDKTQVIEQRSQIVCAALQTVAILAIAGFV